MAGRNDRWTPLIEATITSANEAMKLLLPNHFFCQNSYFVRLLIGKRKSTGESGFGQGWLRHDRPYHRFEKAFSVFCGYHPIASKTCQKQLDKRKFRFTERTVQNTRWNNVEAVELLLPFLLKMHGTITLYCVTNQKNTTGKS